MEESDMTYLSIFSFRRRFMCALGMGVRPDSIWIWNFHSIAQTQSNSMALLSSIADSIWDQKEYQMELGQRSEIFP